MISDDERERLWEDFLDAQFKFRQLRGDLYQSYDVEDEYAKIRVLKKDLTDVRKRFFLYKIIESMPVKRQQLLVEELLPLAAMNETKRSFNPAEKIVLSWDAEWLKAKLYDVSRKTMERISAGDFSYIDLADFYSGLIMIFREIDKARAREIMEEAVTHADADVREVGISWRDDIDW
jgi:hypothetical protein